VFPLTELGKRLREAREERNMSLDDLQEITKIQKRYLIGIEEGNYAIMPGKFYVRAFIKQYAEAVGLDPDELFEQYASDIPSIQQEEELPGQLSRVKSRQLSEKGAKLIDLLPKLLVVTAVVGIAVVLWIFFQNRNVNEEPRNEVIEKTTEFEQSKNIVQQSDESEEPEETQQDDQQDELKEEEKEKLSLQVVETSGWESTMELSGSEKFILEISTKGDSWIEVKNAKGKSFFRNMMYENQSQTFDLTNETEVLLVIGYAPNAEIKINGEIVPYPIDPNSEVRQDIKIIYKKG
jgi:cytoskeletal protein RodZ